MISFYNKYFDLANIILRLAVFVSLIIWFLLQMNIVVLAQDTPVTVSDATLLPKAKYVDKCVDNINQWESENQEGKKFTIPTSDLLGCAIATGRMKLVMVPYFISYFSNYLLGIVSLISLLFVVIGGVQYTIYPYTNTKDKGKAYIKNALIGMVFAFLAWSFVNIILSIFTA